MIDTNDLRGIKIEVGDKVAYATRHGSTTTMNVGTVEAIEPFPATRHYEETFKLKIRKLFHSDLYDGGGIGKLVEITAVERVVVVAKRAVE